MVFFDFLKMKLTIILLVIVAAAAAGAYTYHKIVVANLEKDLATTKLARDVLARDNGTLKRNVKDLTASINKQNLAIRALQDEVDRTTNEAEAALKLAQAQVRKWKVKYQDVLNSPRPVADDCQALDIKLDQYHDLLVTEEATP